MERVTRYISNCLKLNYSLLIALLISSIIPTLYSTFRIQLLGSLPDNTTFSIISQHLWIQALYEILQEGLLLPLYFLLGKSISNPSKLATRITLSLLIFCFVYLVVSSMIIYYLDHIIEGMHQQPEFFLLTKQYIKLEIFAIGLSSICLFMNIIFTLLNAERYIYYLLAIQFISNIIFDSILVSNFTISFKFGVLGVAYTKIIVNFLLIAASILFITRLKITLSLRNWKEQYCWMKDWGKLFMVSGSESLIKNVVYIVMILSMLNSIEQSGTYWIANEFIWGWLLLPIISLSNLIKADVAENRGKIEYRLTGYFIVTTFFIIIWCITIPFWQFFLLIVMNISDYKPVLSLIHILVFFYIPFSYKNILDSYFYGLGKINYLLIQTSIVNFLYYGAAYLAYHFGYIQFDLTKIAYLFGGGIIFSLVVTLFIFFLSGCNYIVWGNHKKQSKKFV